MQLFPNRDPLRESRMELLVRRTGISLAIILLLIAFAEVFAAIHRNAGLH